jgi:phosphoribosyl-AMP cyclohydrolase
VTVVAQCAKTGEVLMVAFTDETGYLETVRTREAVYLTTSRGNKRWKKGETSGDVQKVHDILIDCDGDAIIYVVDQHGSGACHTKARSCFYRSVFSLEKVLMEAPGAGENEELRRIEI